MKSFEFRMAYNKVDVPESVLENLKCVKCSLYLSVKPITYNEENDLVCGRCHDPQSTITRAKAFEALQSVLLFPCRYQKNGCPSKIKEKNMVAHEIKCRFGKNVNCPFTESSKCTWRGSSKDLREHCKTDHSKFIRSNLTFLLILAKQPFPATHFVITSGYFLVVRSIVTDSESDVCVSVQNIGEESDSELGSYEIEFMSVHATIKYSNEILRYMDNNSAAFQNGNVRVDIKLLKDILKITDEASLCKLTVTDFATAASGQKLPSTANQFSETADNQFNEKKERIQKLPFLVNQIYMIKEESNDSKKLLSEVTQTNKIKEGTMDVAGSLQLKVEFSCPNCSKFLSGPIKVCANGHSFCGSCMDKYNACLICQVPYQGARNTLMENLILKMQLPCDNKIFGCGYDGKEVGLGERSLDYLVRRTECPLKFSNINCRWKGVWKCHVTHLLQDHKSLISYVSESGMIFQHDLKSNLSLGFMILQFKDSGIYMRLRFSQNSLGYYSWTFHQIGVKEGYPSQYRIEMEFVDQAMSKKSLKIGFPCFGCINYDFVEDFHCDAHLLKPFISKDQILSVKYRAIEHE